MGTYAYTTQTNICRLTGFSLAFISVVFSDH